MSHSHSFADDLYENIWTTPNDLLLDFCLYGNIEDEGAFARFLNEYIDFEQFYNEQLIENAFNILKSDGKISEWETLQTISISGVDDDITVDLPSSSGLTGQIKFNKDGVFEFVDERLGFSGGKLIKRVTTIIGQYHQTSNGFILEIDVRGYGDVDLYMLIKTESGMKLIYIDCVVEVENVKHSYVMPVEPTA